MEACTLVFWPSEHSWPLLLCPQTLVVNSLLVLVEIRLENVDNEGEIVFIMASMYTDNSEK